MITLPTRIDLFAKLPRGAFVAEVGVWRAYLSVEILKNPIAKLYCVDAWKQQRSGIEVAPDAEHEANYREALHNLRGHLKGGRVEVIREWSPEASLDPRIKPLDMAYIDGAHDYDSVLADLIAWEKKLKPTGVLAGHDYCDHAEAKKWGFGVIPAVNDFCRDHGWEIVLLTDEDFPSYCLSRKAWRGAEL